MKKHTLRIFLSFLGVLVTILVIVSFRHTREKTELEAQINRVIKEYSSQSESYIDFTDVAGFSWDKVYIFGPYSNCRNITKVLDTRRFWFECKLSGIEEREGSSLIVFMKNRLITQYIMYFGVTVSQNTNSVGIPFDSAKFVLDDQGRLALFLDN